MGLRGCPNTEVSFEDVEVPADHLIGIEGRGFDIAKDTFRHARLTAATMAIGIGRGALIRAVDYAKTRRQFGQAIFDHQGLQFMLAEMTTALEAGWALVEKATEIVESSMADEAGGVYASMAKLFCTDAAMDVVVDAVQVFGGYGLSKDYPVERYMRDAKAFQIFDGTNQIQKVIIGRQLGRRGVPFYPQWLSPINSDTGMEVSR